VTPPLTTRVRRGTRSILVTGLLRALSFIPVGPAVRIGAFLGRLAASLFGATRRLAIQNLGLAFPEMSLAERDAIARRMFVHLGMSAMEITSIRSFNDQLERYMAVEGGQVLTAALARGKGVVFVTGHVGNWELMARVVARIGAPVSAVAKRGGDVRAMRLIEGWRADGAVTTLWREDASTARALLKVFKENRVLGLLVDQDTNVQGIWVPFFGRPAWSARAPADLALRSGAPILVGTSHRPTERPGDGMRFEIVEIPYDPKPVDKEAEVVRITAACQAALESAIRRHPADWVWMHERWKTQPPPPPPVPE
jgi:KDO2-lipid IV(A) lauroyltransferase